MFFKEVSTISNNIIEFKQVYKEYKLQNGEIITVLDGINLEIKKADIYGIIGYSGAGKSTLIRGINGLEKVDSGEIIVLERVLSELKYKEMRNFRKHTGMIFQHFNLLDSLTVLENVLLPLKKSGLSSDKKEKKAKELLNYVGLLDKTNSYPSQLSGGQKQRVSIARALVNDPEILLCDEATSALDPKTTTSILQLLRELNEKLGITIVLITHEMSVIKEICHKVAILNKGNILEKGKVEDVFMKPSHKLTEEFIETTSNLSKSKQIIKNYLQNDKEKNSDVTFLRLNFNDSIVDDSIVFSVAKEFNVDINILLADISFFNQKHFGSLFIAIKGKLKNDAINEFTKRNVVVEVMSIE